MKRLLLVFALTTVGLILVASPAFAPCHSITFANEPYSVAENAGKVTITVSNGAGAQTQDEMVDYKTVNGTAKAGQDFVGKSGTVKFGANSGAAELSFDIVIKDNKIHEKTESFTVELSNVRPPSSCAPPPSIDQSSATVTITDNDKLLASPTPTPTPTKSSAKPTPKPKSPSASPSPSITPTPTPTPTPTTSAVAAPSDDGGGLSGGALAGIVIGAIAVGGAAAFFVRRRFLT